MDVFSIRTYCVCVSPALTVMRQRNSKFYCRKSISQKNFDCINRGPIGIPVELSDTYIATKGSTLGLPIRCFTEASDSAVSSDVNRCIDCLTWLPWGVLPIDLMSARQWDRHRLNLVSRPNQPFAVQSKFILSLSRLNLYSTGLQRHQLVRHGRKTSNTSVNPLTPNTISLSAIFTIFRRPSLLLAEEATNLVHLATLSKPLLTGLQIFLPAKAMLRTPLPLDRREGTSAIVGSTVVLMLCTVGVLHVRMLYLTAVTLSCSGTVMRVARHASLTHCEWSRVSGVCVGYGRGFLLMS